MRKINVNRNTLLTKLKENKVKHVENYNQAVIEYKQACLVEIDENITKLQQLKEKISTPNTIVSLSEEANVFFEVAQPTSHENDYNEIIEMFSMEVHDVVELDSIEFAKYVMDNWTWKEELRNQRLFYAVKQAAFTK